MKDDIVARLRNYESRVLAAAPYFRELILTATDEIERLRTVEEAWKTYSSRAERDIADLREERDRMRQERDEARHAQSVAIATLQGVIEESPLLHAKQEIERLRAELRTYTGDGHNTKGEPCTPNTPS